MGFYQNPIGPPDPFDKYRVEGAGEKKTEEDFAHSEENQEKNTEPLNIRAYLLYALQKAVNYFLERHGNPEPAEIDFKKNLLSLKNHFEILKQEDRSQDVEFLNALSKTWNQLIDNSSHIKNEGALLKFKLLVKKIFHYPENQTHTFGYYLTEYAGQKWVPFPYMELVQKIHSEHEKNPESSALGDWALLSEEILKALIQN